MLMMHSSPKLGEPIMVRKGRLQSACGVPSPSLLLLLLLVLLFSLMLLLTSSSFSSSSLSL